MKATPTKRQKDELARRKAMTFAVIHKPLQFIRASTNTREIVKGEVKIVESFESIEAMGAASRGHGGHVNHIARQVALRQ